MFRNYFNIALRNLKKHKGYSFINIIGLSVGLTCCIFILLYVMFELSFDAHHSDIDRIYLVGTETHSDRGRGMTFDNMAMTIPMLRERFPQVEIAARVNVGWITQVSADEIAFKEQG